MESRELTPAELEKKKKNEEKAREKELKKLKAADKAAAAKLQSWSNDEVELEMDMIKSVVKSLRSLRSQLPRDDRLRGVAAIVRCRTNAASDVIKRHDLEITTLARLSSLTVLSENDDIPVGCFVDVVNDSLSVFLKKQGSSNNVEAEVEKLRKKRERTQKQYDSLKKKTSAAGYQEKVPARIREADEAKLSSLLQEILSFNEASEQLERENPQSSKFVMNLNFGRWIGTKVISFFWKLMYKLVDALL